jgi:hypothetical protein
LKWKKGEGNMGTKYRVDASKSAVVVPCGMLSIRCLTDNWKEARKVYAETEPHKDVWGGKNMMYGVTLAVWNEEKRDYVVKCSKGFDHG